MMDPTVDDGIREHCLLSEEFMETDQLKMRNLCLVNENRILETENKVLKQAVLNLENRVKILENDPLSKPLCSFPGPEAISLNKTLVIYQDNEVPVAYEVECTENTETVFFTEMQELPGSEPIIFNPVEVQIQIFPVSEDSEISDLSGEDDVGSVVTGVSKGSGQVAEQISGGQSASGDRYGAISNDLLEKLFSRKHAVKASFPIEATENKTGRKKKTKSVFVCQFPCKNTCKIAITGVEKFSQLLNHYRKKHLDKEFFYCEPCKKHFINIKSYKFHNQSKHGPKSSVLIGKNLKLN